MRMIVTSIDSAAGKRALDVMRSRGLPAVLVWSEATAWSGGQATLLVGAHDRDVGDVCATLASLAAVTEPSAQTLLPLSDPTDLHVGRPPLPALSLSGLYVLRVSRFEQIW